MLNWRRARIPIT